MQPSFIKVTLSVLYIDKCINIARYWVFGGYGPIPSSYPLVTEGSYVDVLAIGILQPVI